MASVRESRFEAIYHVTDSSGSGSEKHNTTFFNAVLKDFIAKYDIKSILDLACGNFESMEDIVKECGISYLGADISKTIVRRNNERFQPIPFIQMDALTADLSVYGHELLLFRHVVQHLNFNDAQLAIRNIFKSGCKYLLINHQEGLTVNEDRSVRECGWDNQMYNLNIEPFSLKANELYNVNVADMDGHVVDRGQRECYSFYRLR